MTLVMIDAPALPYPSFTYTHPVTAHGNLLAALSILVRLCSHPKLLLPSAATIQKQQQRKLRTPSKIPEIPSEILFQNSDDDATEESFGYANLLAQLPLPLQQQLQQEPTAQQVAHHGAKVSHRPHVATATFAHSLPQVSVLLSLLLSLRDSGHRTLIFSQSRVMLDLIQVCWCVSRAAAGALTV
jgi:SNF2 family DNA or RNA helicase